MGKDDAASSSLNRDPLTGMDERMREHLDSLVLDHPYRHMIENEANNPTAIIVNHLLSLIEQDKRRELGICEYCFSDSALTPAKQNKNHSNKYGVHFWACEERHNPAFWRNPITGELIQHTVVTPPDSEISKEIWDAEKQIGQLHCTVTTSERMVTV